MTIFIALDYISRCAEKNGLKGTLDLLYATVTMKSVRCYGMLAYVNKPFLQKVATKTMHTLQNCEEAEAQTSEGGYE